MPWRRSRSLQQGSIIVALAVVIVAGLCWVVMIAAPSTNDPSRESRATGCVA